MDSDEDQLSMSKRSKAKTLVNKDVFEYAERQKTVEVHNVDEQQMPQRFSFSNRDEEAMYLLTNRTSPTHFKGKS